MKNLKNLTKPLVSCLMVTQEERLINCKRAIRQYAKQSWVNKEIIVVCDGSTKYNERLKSDLSDVDALIEFIFVEKKYSLGELRNISVQSARGEIICQWDDDDQYHHKRIELQVQRMLNDQADFCFLTDQLHYFKDSNDLFWVDWRRDSSGKFHSFSPDIVAIPGTLMAKKKCMPSYIDIKLGEDSYLIDDIFTEYKIALIKGLGWTYLYVYHGGNTFDRQHHSDIAGLHRMLVTKSELLDKLTNNKDNTFTDISGLLKELKEYDLPLSVNYSFI